MKQSTLRAAALAGIAFAAGIAVSRAPVAVRAQGSPIPVPVVAMSPTFVQDVKKLSTQPAPPCFPNARVATISKSSIATVQYAVGTLPAHYHTTANEIQLVIPPRTVHSGMKPVPNTNLKLLVIKVPEQRATPDDNFIGTPPPSHC